jgi:hypothetical protein
MIDSSQHLNCHSIFIPMIARLGRKNLAGQRGLNGWPPGGGPIATMGKAKMSDIGMVAAMPAAEPADAEDCFGLGMNYSSGAGVAVDLVQAHKWFNIAAMRGHQDGARLRREIAEQMSDAEIGCAQRAARDWLKSHPQAPVEAPAIRAAA